MPPPKGRKIAASKRKKQTRLAFDPVDQSSSQAPGPSPAKVRYAKPAPLSKGYMPSSSLQIEVDSDSGDPITSSALSARFKPPARKNGKLPFKKAAPLPTPVKSLQLLGGSRGRKSLEFEDDSEDEIANTTFSLQPTRSSARKRSAQKPKPDIHIDSGSSDGSSPEPDTYTPSKAKNKPKARSMTVTISSDDSEEASRTPSTKTGSKDKSSKLAVVIPSPNLKGENSTLSKARRTSGTTVILSSSEEEEDLLKTRIPKSRKSKPLFSTVPKGESSSPPQALQEDSDSDDIIMSTQARRKRPAIRADDDDDEYPVSSPLKRARPMLESDDSDIASSPLKRRRPSEVYNEDEPSEDELQTLRKSPSRDPTPSRTMRPRKKRRHRTEKEKMLELLKRRRAGENIEDLTESESESEDESESDLQELSEFEDEEVSQIVVAKAEKAVRKRQAGTKSGSDLDDYESDFIEDDDDGNIGVPAHSLLDIPLEFTHAAHKPLKEHFRDAVEWMVHNKINPAFNRKDPIYDQAFKKLAYEYGGYAQSKFVSTQWTAEFIRAINARPEFLVRDLAPGEEIEIAGEVICQVCNHRKYVPKYEIQFSGKAYHLDTLEEIENDDSSDESDGSAESQKRESVNADGQVIPSEERTWLSGQYCKANAEQAHSLIHWKYALNQWVLGTLEFEGYLTPEKLAQREKMKSKQRRKYANDIVDDWEGHGQIKDLYRDFKINLETARNSTQADFKGRWRK